MISEKMFREFLKERREMLIEKKAKYLGEVTFGQDNYNNLQGVVDMIRNNEEVDEDELDMALAVLYRDMESLGYEIDEHATEEEDLNFVFRKSAKQGRWYKGATLFFVQFDLLDPSGIVVKVGAANPMVDEIYDFRYGYDDLAAESSKIFDNIRAAVDHAIKNEERFDLEVSLDGVKSGEVKGQLELPLESKSLVGLLLNEDRTAWEESGAGFGSSDWTPVIDSFERMVNSGMHPMDAATDLADEYPINPSLVLFKAANAGIIDEFWGDLYTKRDEYAEMFAPREEEDNLPPKTSESPYSTKRMKLAKTTPASDGGPDIEHWVNVEESKSPRGK